jgi:hypothetical protein
VDNQPLRFAAEYRIDNPASKNPAFLAIGESSRDTPTPFFVDNQPLRFAAEYRIDNPASKNPALLAIGVSLRDVHFWRLVCPCAMCPCAMFQISEEP